MTGKWQNNVKTKCLWQISFSCNFIMFLSLSCQFSLISLMFSWLYCVCCYVPVFFFTFLMFFLFFLYFFIGFLHFSIDFFPFSLLSITVSLVFFKYSFGFSIFSLVFFTFSLFLFNCSMVLLLSCLTWLKIQREWQKWHENDRTMSKPNVCGKYHFPVILSCFCHFPVSFHWFP